jgi:hypothetical protein
MIKTLLALFILLSSLKPAHSKSNFSIGFNKNLKDTQNSNGKVDDKPYSPYISWGSNFKIADLSFGFSPQIGYIHTIQTADDSYGKQKVHSFFIHWDFLYVPEFSDQFAFRFGIGNFIKRTYGEGGTVTIPNGTGTSTARRPDSTVNSYSNTFNLGADYNLDLDFSGDWLSDLGIRFETFIFRPLSQDYRSYAFNLGLLLYY